jgi:hypothetical protein
MGWLGNILGLDDPMRSSQYGLDPYGDLKGQAGYAGNFADVGQRGYEQMGNELDTDREYLRRLQRGQNSVAMEQLRGGLQQNLAAQRSMAASARPGMAPMAARTAAIQGARLGGGLAGQQAVAGLQERNMAAQQLAQMNLGQRGQDINVALGSRQNALNGYGTLENSAASRYGADMGTPSKRESLIGGLSSVGAAYASK